MDIMGNLSGDLIALFVTSSLIYFLSSRAQSVGLVDKPSIRKDHEGEIPTIGGITIFGGFLLALLSSLKMHTQGSTKGNCRST